VRRRAIVLGLALLALALGCRVPEPEDSIQDGVRAPDFELEDLAGERVSLESLRGRPVVLDFWATWCTPCLFQIPVLNAFQSAQGDRVQVVGVAVDADGREVVAPFAREHDIQYRVLLGGTDLAQRFGAPGFPTLFVLTPEGVIASAHVGVIDEAALEEAVEAARTRKGAAMAGARQGP
jgi:thiol-disulfide isomerase/thioredoxin